MTKNTISPAETWVDQYGDYLYRFAIMRLRNHEAAQNAVQETLLAALKGQQSFSGKSTERTWLTGILKHKIIDHFRASSREIVASELQQDEQAINDFFDQTGHFKNYPQQWQYQPDAMITSEEFWNAFRECLAKLPPVTAQVFSMREVDKIDSKTICKELDITSSNFWVMMHRARLQLRQCLEQNYLAEPCQETGV